jgi:hypothetical protein
MLQPPGTGGNLRYLTVLAWGTQVIHADVNQPVVRGADLRVQGAWEPYSIRGGEGNANVNLVARDH